MPKEIKRKKGLIEGVESELISIVRESEGISRLSLSKKLKLAPSTVGIYVERLLEEGFLLEAKKQKAVRSGRPEVFLTLNPERGEFIGVDFYAEHILAMSVDFSNNLLKEFTVKLSPDDSQEEVLGKLSKAIKAVYSDEREVLGIGLSVPGSLDVEKGVLIKYKWLPKLQNVKFGEHLKQEFGLPVYFENTANLMAIGEMKFGEDKSLSNFVSVTIRSGVGCGVVINKSIVAGENNLCGEIEYWKCPASFNNSEESFAELGELISSSGIMRTLKHALAEDKKSSLSNTSTIVDFIAALKAEDSLAIEVFEQSIPVLGWTLGQISLMLAPERFVLAGDFVELGEQWLDLVQASLEEYYDGLPMTAPEVKISTLGKSCAALGAVSLAIQNWRISR
ncbi:MAG: ROK family transcriptional regulator [Lentisphaeraceae bacterium]|nr:ROK family transcriptional regulator [Lentisphaeraceae bacterium]